MRKHKTTKPKASSSRFHFRFSGLFFLLLGVIGVLVLVVMGTHFIANASDVGQRMTYEECIAKYGVKGKFEGCHATGSSKNPYVKVKVSCNALKNENGGHSDDILADVTTGQCPNETTVVSTEKPITICKVNDVTQQKMPGWMIYLTGDATTSAFLGETLTDGCITFDKVPYGSYKLSEDLKPGWHTVSGVGMVTVNASSPNSYTVVNHQDYKVFDIKACKYYDKDRNLETTADRVTYADWPFNLYKDDVKVAMNNTGADGCVVFKDIELQAGYSVTEDPMPGWTPLTPASVAVENPVEGEERLVNFINFQEP